MEFLYGFVGSLFGIVIFLIGFSVGRRTASPVKKVPEPTVSDTEKDRMQKERDRLMAEQRAFRNLVGYSADVAYGLADFPTEVDVE